MPRIPAFSSGGFGYAGGGSPDSIAEIILRGGQRNAELEARGGDIWSGAIGNITQQVGGAVSGYQKTQEEEKKKAALKAQDDAFVARLSDPAKPLTAKDAVSIYGTERGLPIFKAFESLQTKEPDEATIRAGMRAATPEMRAQAWPAIRAHVVAAGGSQAAAVLPEQYDEDWWQRYEKAREGPQKLTPVSKDSRLVGPAGNVVLDAVPEPAKVPTTLEGRLMAAEPGSPEYKRLLQIDKDQAAAKRDPNADAAPSLTPQALDVTARLFAQTGQLPPMGMGKEGARVRQAIINRAAELGGADLDIGGNKAAYGADKASLGKLQAQTDAVSAFETTATKNAGLLDDILKKLPDSGTSLLNKPLRAASTALGSEDMATFNTLRQSVANEYARIISNPSLAGTMSDSARHEADILLSPDATVGQIRAALKALSSEAANRHSSYQGQIGEIKGRIGGSKGGAPANAADPLGILGGS